MIKTVFGREPALWFALLASVAQLIPGLFLPVSDTQQGVINAAASTLAGALTAVFVVHERVAPALLGVLQSAVALGVAFGAPLDPTQQAVIMSAASMIVGMFVRTQVIAPVPPEFGGGRHEVESRMRG